MKQFCLSCAGSALIFVIGIGAFGLWLSAHWRKNILGAECPSNLRHIGMGIFMYQEDYNGKLPPAIFPGKTVGWVLGAQPYFESSPLFQCPYDSHPRQKYPDKPGFTDYWLNGNLTGVKSNMLRNKSKIIMLGDGDGGSTDSTASYAITKLPAEWRTASNSSAKRHDKGANYAFLDGHVKWLKPDQIAQVPPSEKSQFYTFLLK